MAKIAQNTKTSEKSKAAKQPQEVVYVVSYRYSDRHGSDGASIVGVFRNKDDAAKAKSKDIKGYLKSQELLNPDGTLNTCAIMEIDGKAAESQTLGDALNAGCINVDGDGTWCEWSITKKTIK